MTDIYDQATAIEEQEREASIAAQRAKSKQAGAALSHCEDCGEEIPADRHAAVKNCRRCYRCAQAEDARRKLYRR